jgi:hypothetical protein
MKGKEKTTEKYWEEHDGKKGEVRYQGSNLLANIERQSRGKDHEM